MTFSDENDIFSDHLWLKWQGNVHKWCPEFLGFFRPPPPLFQLMSLFYDILFWPFDPPYQSTVICMIQILVLIFDGSILKLTMQMWKK